MIMEELIKILTDLRIMELILWFVITLTIIVLLVISDMLIGLNKSKKNNIPIAASGLSDTLFKLYKYGSITLMAFVIDIVLNIAIQTFNVFPEYKEKPVLLVIFLVLTTWIEVKSMMESAEMKKYIKAKDQIKTFINEHKK